MRIFPLAVLAAITVAAGSVTAAVALADGSATTVANRPGNQRLVGIHQWSLNDGVTPEEFERFVAEEWNSGMSNRVPGLRVLVMKGERHASANEYLVVYDFQSVDVRDWYWPTPDRGGVHCVRRPIDQHGRANELHGLRGDRTRLNGRPQGAASPERRSGVRGWPPHSDSHRQSLQTRPVLSASLSPLRGCESRRPVLDQHRPTHGLPQAEDEALATGGHVEGGPPVEEHRPGVALGSKE